MPVFLGLRKKPLVRVIKIQRERIINHERREEKGRCFMKNRKSTFVWAAAFAAVMMPVTACGWHVPAKAAIIPLVCDL